MDTESDQGITSASFGKLEPAPDTTLALTDKPFTMVGWFKWEELPPRPRVVGYPRHSWVWQNGEWAPFPPRT